MLEPITLLNFLVSGKGFSGWKKKVFFCLIFTGDFERRKKSVKKYYYALCIIFYNFGSLCIEKKRKLI